MSRKASDQPSTPPVDTWQKTFLTTELNDLHKDRTLEIFLVAECDDSCSSALEKLEHAGNIDRLHEVKAFSYPKMLKALQDPPTGDNETIEKLCYAKAAKSVAECVTNYDPTPLNLLALLIKLQILFTVKEDVFLTQKKIYQQQNLEKECQDMIAVEGKGGKPAAPAKGKPYDVCDPTNEPKFKPTSMLTKVAQELPPELQLIPVEPKHLIVIILGVYELEIIEELAKICVPLTAVVELRPLCNMECTGSDDCFDRFSMKDSTNPSPDDDPFKLQLFSFWNRILEYLEGDDGCPEYLNDVMHMTLNFPKDIYDPSLTTDPRHCLKVLQEVATILSKSFDIKRQHVNYIRHLRMYEIGPRPKKARSSHFKRYNGVLEKIPAECKNILAVVHAIVEEVRQRVPDPPRIPLETPPSSVMFSEELDEKNVSLFGGIRNQVAELLNKQLNCHVQFGSQALQEIKKPKTQTSIPAFLVQENNEIEIMSNSYPKIRPELLDIYFEKLILNAPVLLWRRFPYCEKENQKRLEKIYRLQEVAEVVELPLNELQYVIHTMFFSAVKCRQKDKSCCLDLLEFLPKKAVKRVVFKKKIPYKPHIDVFDSDIPDLESPPLFYVDEPNLYEGKNIPIYTWYEILPILLLLQELFQAEQEYLCSDYRFCSFDDSILLRYHNNVDEFGINTTFWAQSLRTPITSTREFCKFILHEDFKWLEEEQRKYTEEENERVKNIRDDLHNERKEYYPELVFTDLDFLQRNSLKDRALYELLNPSSGEGRGKGGKEAAAKGTSAKDKGGKSAGGYPNLERLTQPPVIPLLPKASLRCANPNEPFSFYAYDLGEKRVHLVDSTTIFHSLDGFKVTVDRTRLVNQPKRLSMGVTLGGHSLFLHRHETIKEQFSFHFLLQDKTVLVFGKPFLVSPEEKLAEKIKEAAKKKEEKRQDVYFISETHNAVLRRFKVPYICRRKLILSEDMINPFLERMLQKGVKVRLVPNENVTPEEAEVFEETLSILSKKNTSKTDLKYIEPKHYFNIIERVEEEEQQEEEEEPPPEILPTKIPYSEDPYHKKFLLRSNRDLIRRIRHATEDQLPIFKICSTRLHKYQYVKRVKSRVEIPARTILKRLPCKPFVGKPTVELGITKLFPVKPFDTKKNTAYDFKITLPSGLHVESVDGTEGSPFNIRQRYLDKGIANENLDEVSRTFTRNGTIIIKKHDGNFDVLINGGLMAKCEVPYFKIPRKNQGEGAKHKGEHSIPLHAFSLSKFQKHLVRSINRLSRHLVDDEKQYLLSYRAGIKKKRHIKNPLQIYLLQKSVGFLKKFILITNEGKRLKVTPTVINEKKAFYSRTETDYRYQEVYNSRQDGTHSILNGECLLVTQFPDSTRISTWAEIDKELLFMEEPPEVVDDSGNTKQQQVYERDLDGIIEVPEETEQDSLEHLSTMTFGSEGQQEEEQEKSPPSARSSKSQDIVEGWVSVHLNVKYEHPNYATLIHYGKNSQFEIVSPNDVVITVTSSGEYHIDFGETVCSEVTAEEVTLEGRLCKMCLQKSFVKLNVGPLYFDVPPEQDVDLLAAYDTYGKIFTVDFEGQCGKNIKYKKGRSNLSGCPNHVSHIPQKLFILQRNLVGCKLWEERRQKKHFAEAIASGEEITDRKTLIEIKKHIMQPFHERFVIPYLEPILQLTKYKTKPPPPKDIAYVTRQIIHKLPEMSRMYPIYSFLFKVCENGATKSADFENGVQTFLHHIVGYQDYIDNLNIEEPPPPPPPPPPKPKGESFSVRHKRKLKQRMKYLRDIKQNVLPKYFCSLINQIPVDCWCKKQGLPCTCDQNSLHGSIASKCSRCGCEVCHCDKPHLEETSPCWHCTCSFTCVCDEEEGNTYYKPACAHHHTTPVPEEEQCACECGVCPCEEEQEEEGIKKAPSAKKIPSLKIESRCQSMTLTKTKSRCQSMTMTTLAPTQLPDVCTCPNEDKDARWDKCICKTCGCYTEPPDDPTCTICGLCFPICRCHDSFEIVLTPSITKARSDPCTCRVEDQQVCLQTPCSQICPCRPKSCTCEGVCTCVSPIVSPAASVCVCKVCTCEDNKIGPVPPINSEISQGSPKSEIPLRKMTCFTPEFLSQRQQLIKSEKAKMTLNKITNILRAASFEYYGDEDNASMDKVEAAESVLYQEFKEHQNMTEEQIDETVRKILNILNCVEVILLLDLVDRTWRQLAECTATLAPAAIQESNVTDILRARAIFASKPKEEKGENFASYFYVYKHYAAPTPTNKSKGSSSDLCMIYSKDTKSDTSIHQSIHPCESSPPQRKPSSVHLRTPPNPYLEVCEKCCPYEEPLPMPMHSEVLFKLPSDDSDVSRNLHVPSMVGQFGSPRTSPLASSITLFTGDGSISTTNMVKYCLSENLTKVEDPSTMILHADEEENPSTMVMFSLGSLKNKSGDIIRPYVERDPDEVAKKIMEVVGCASTTKLQPVSCTSLTSRKRLMTDESLHNCRRCILQVEEEESEDYGSQTDIKTESQAESIESLKKYGEQKESKKYSGGAYDATVEDEDIQIAKGYVPKKSKTLLEGRKPSKKFTKRKSIGSQTNPKLDVSLQTCPSGLKKK